MRANHAFAWDRLPELYKITSVNVFRALTLWFWLTSTVFEDQLVASSQPVFFAFQALSPAACGLFSNFVSGTLFDFLCMDIYCICRSTLGVFVKDGLFLKVSVLYICMCPQCYELLPWLKFGCPSLQFTQKRCDAQFTQKLNRLLCMRRRVRKYKYACNLKPYSCRCGKKFTSLRGRELHERTHTKEKPNTCSYSCV